MTFEIGQRIQTISQHPAEQDAGRVREIEGDSLIVAWDSGVVTKISANEVEAE